MKNAKFKIQSLGCALALFTFLIFNFKLSAQLPTNNPTPGSVSVTVATNGALLAPANFFSANAAALNASVTNAGGISSNYTGALHFTNPANVFGGNGSNLTNLQPSNFAGVTAIAQGGTGANNQAGAQANLEAPIYTMVMGPSQSPTLFVTDAAINGQGAIVYYSYDGLSWRALFPDGRIQFTNSPGMHDFGSCFNAADNNFYFPYTAQGANLFTPGITNVGIIKTADFVNFTQVGYFQIGTGGMNSITWSPDCYHLPNGSNILYAMENTNASGSFAGLIRGVLGDNTMMNWSAPFVLATNESAIASGSPFGAGNGLNDPYMFGIITNVWAINSAGQSNLIAAGTTAGFFYNWSTVQYDLYTNATALMPVQLHLCLTNMTAFPNATEAGQVLQKQNGNYGFYGAVGLNTSLTKGRLFYSEATGGTLGPFTNATLCFMYPRYPFGQGTVSSLVGSNKLKLQNAIAAASGSSPNPPYPLCATAISLRQIPGYGGPCMDVTRSSDGATATFGFASGWLDTNSLLSFCGSGNGYVVKVYGQDINHTDYTNAATNAAFRVVTSGSLVVDQIGHPSMACGPGLFLCSTKPVNLNGGYSAFTWTGTAWATANYSAIFESADYSSTLGNGFLDQTGGSVLGWNIQNIIAVGGGYGAYGNGFTYAFATPSGGFLNSTNNGRFYELEAHVGSTNTGIYINGASATTATTGAGALSIGTNLYVGGNGATANDFQLSSGRISELILFPVALPSWQQAQVRADVLGVWNAPASNTAQGIATAGPVVFTGPAALNTASVNALTLSNGAILQVNSSFSGPVVSNGISMLWNSNGNIYLRTSRPGATNWQDTLTAQHP